MTVAVVVLSVVVAVLVVLVAGLLRSHALILRRLHEAGLGLEELAGGRDALPLAGGDGTGASTPAAVPDHDHTPRPSDAPAGRPAADVAGVTPAGGSIGLAVTGVEHDTLLLFLSADCATCQRFWAVLSPDAPTPPVLPDGMRLAVVTRGPEHESPPAVAAHPATVPVVMSDDAWQAYTVPGSPYAVHVDGATGRVRGEGTGGDWDQVAQLLARATGELAYVGEHTPRARKARRDRVAEQDTDAVLLAAGILPGDDSLYRRADGTRVAPPGEAGP